MTKKICARSVEGVWLSQFSSSSSALDPTVKLRAKEGIPLSDPIFYRKLVGK